MKKAIYYTLLSIAVLGTGLIVYAMIHALLGPANATGLPSYCIPVADGSNTCLTMSVLQDLLTIFAIGLIIVLAFKKRIFKL